MVDSINNTFCNNSNKGAFVIINIPDRDIEWPDCYYWSWEYHHYMDPKHFGKYIFDDVIYYNVDSFNTSIKHYECYEVTASNVYTSAAEYDKEHLYYNETSDYEECFCFKVAKGTLKDINCNYSLEQFKTQFNLNY